MTSRNALAGLGRKPIFLQLREHWNRRHPLLCGHLYQGSSLPAHHPQESQEDPSPTKQGDTQTNNFLNVQKPGIFAFFVTKSFLNSVSLRIHKAKLHLR